MSGYGFSVGASGHENQDRLVNWQRADSNLDIQLVQPCHKRYADRNTARDLKTARVPMIKYLKRDSRVSPISRGVKQAALGDSFEAFSSWDSPQVAAYK